MSALLDVLYQIVRAIADAVVPAVSQALARPDTSRTVEPTDEDRARAGRLKDARDRFPGV